VDAKIGDELVIFEDGTCRELELTAGLDRQLRVVAR